MSDEVVYICNRCGERFSIEEGSRYYVDGEAWTRCPNCYSDDIEEATRCPVCREIVFEYKMKGGVCPDCFTEAQESYKSAIGYLQPWEREALELEYGNIDVTEE